MLFPDCFQICWPNLLVSYVVLRMSAYCIQGFFGQYHTSKIVFPYFSFIIIHLRNLSPEKLYFQLSFRFSNIAKSAEGWYLSNCLVPNTYPYCWILVYVFLLLPFCHPISSPLPISSTGFHQLLKNLSKCSPRIFDFMLLVVILRHIVFTLL